MTNVELNQLIDWCRQKVERENAKPCGLSGKRLEGYREAMLATMSYLHSLKKDVKQ